MESTRKFRFACSRWPLDTPEGRRAHETWFIAQSSCSKGRAAQPEGSGPLIRRSRVRERLHPLHLLIPVPHHGRLRLPLPQHAVDHRAILQPDPPERAWCGHGHQRVRSSCRRKRLRRSVRWVEGKQILHGDRYIGVLIRAANVIAGLVVFFLVLAGVPTILAGVFTFVEAWQSGIDKKPHSKQAIIRLSHDAGPRFHPRPVRDPRPARSRRHGGRLHRA